MGGVPCYKLFTMLLVYFELCLVGEIKEGEGNH